jgi:hypothetical protein
MNSPINEILGQEDDSDEIKKRELYVMNSKT